MIEWLRKLFIWHRWEYRDPADRTCRVCGKREVQYCSDIDDFFNTASCWWEVADDGNVENHYQPKGQP